MAIASPKGLGIALILVGCAFVNAWGQTAAPSPEKEESASSDQVSGSTPVPISSASDPKPDQDPTLSPTPTPTPKDQDDKGKPKKPKRGSLVIAPIPISSPALGSGLVLAIGYVFKLNQEDKLSPPSTVGLVGARTNGGTRGGGLGGRLYFGENKYQTTLVVAKGHANFDFFGIGRFPGADPIPVPLEVGGTVLFAEFMRNVWKDVFVGPRFQYRNLEVSLDGPQTPGGFEIPDIDIKSKSVALGIHVQRDKRDSTFYATKGSLFDMTADFFDQSLGSRRQYQTYKVSYNNYREAGKKGVLAYRAVVCAANENVPFYDLCLYGPSNDLRGYAGGEFQNRRMFATQAEYRRELPKRLGVVAFGGIGGVARRWNEFRSDFLLPSAGVGLRFKLDKKNHINYRIDFAVGREGHTLSIGVGEAF
jgi:Omp85 superfamily domain